ncbi:four helix bundle suffix domain-containing protein [Desulfomicrobium sp. ZS1]|uniref:four helix bundle suffix domain-containing protein n=1 Tax=Desulfomicrobium sp. ZS1 TaxID=2952228 RepID=UPI0020B210AB|nr:four helix bundle suffix domain-containing protein [Desulfomicrobium sp. ZS1]UTF49998.1 four helix bundle suffix domain-containing protein [Desulfomicrobium sp. ZS1]
MIEALIPKHGGYRSLKSFQMAQLVYDVTVLFCERFVNRRSRTHDQMVQAARSGVQNIAEGSQASGTSRKMELKLTSVARASLEELRLDYEDFLRQRGLPQLEPEHPALKRFKARRCAKLDDVRQWVAEEIKRMDEHGLSRTATDNAQGQGVQATPGSVPVRVRPCQSIGSSPSTKPLSPETLAANAALSLLNLACHLLDRQLAAQAENFLQEGGFTERLYRLRSKRRS